MSSPEASNLTSLPKLATEVADELGKGLGGLAQLGVGEGHRQILEMSYCEREPAELRPPSRHQLLRVGAVELNQGEIGQSLGIEAHLDRLIDQLVQVDRVDPGGTRHHRALDCCQETAQRRRPELVLAPRVRGERRGECCPRWGCRRAGPPRCG